MYCRIIKNKNTQTDNLKLLQKIIVFDKTIIDDVINVTSRLTDTKFCFQEYDTIELEILHKYSFEYSKLKDLGDLAIIENKDQIELFENDDY